MTGARKTRSANELCAAIATVKGKPLVLAQFSPGNRVRKAANVPQAVAHLLRHPPTLNLIDEYTRESLM